MANSTLLLRITVYVEPNGDIGILAGSDDAVLDTPEKTEAFTQDLQALVAKYVPEDIGERLAAEPPKALEPREDREDEGVEITVRTLKTLGVWDKVLQMKGCDPNTPDSDKVLLTLGQYESLELMDGGDEGSA